MKDTINKTKIDIESWKRKEHFDFFRGFEQPFWGITAEVDCTGSYEYCKTYNIPFSTFYLYKSLIVANRIPEFRQRIENGSVFEYEKISGSVTVLRENETFGFANFSYLEDFDLFKNELESQISEEKNRYGLKPDFNLNSLIHYSVIPLVRFSSFEHAQKMDIDSVPKIVFGKFNKIENRLFLPISIHVHHALCDGVHVGKFVKAFEKEMIMEY
ncbi:CatA-like O-acetyltransferase [Dyadobacter frigoris]|uniref:Chloramphenicol acetyltransferase n=1 Tax=Dyadobacter frigoris TaxID=2576211 RepID=A0A4U6CWL7_9BACT|nr:CatA-like O-acetyltransferase [Dyadobacter frigoris]TKT88155.1 chloramphenicol acetyltransferase [Dyadobacter frigoris]GLU53771.1 chloramphenicol acetyltransferase [Dyadobacter frigoris]